MTRDEIEDLFEAVTGHNIAHGDKSEGRAMYLSSDEVIEFAALVAAHEREACAKICDAQQDDMPDGTPVTQFMSGQYVMAEYLAERIRARGQS